MRPVTAQNVVKFPRSWDNVAMHRNLPPCKDCGDPVRPNEYHVALPIEGFYQHLRCHLQRNGLG